MKLKIFSPVVNFPQFLELQCIQFRENLLCDYDLYAVDDSKNNSLSEEFISICDTYGATYIKNHNHQNSSPSYAHANTIQYVLDNIIYESCLNDIVFLIDSDCFLMKKINLVEYMKDKVISSFMQSRENVHYLWPGFTLLNMLKLKESKSKIRFFPGSFGGQLCDTGGESHNFLVENNIIPDSIDCKFEGEYMGQNLINMETFMEENFLHFRGGSLWDGKVDVFNQKVEILNNILNHG
jgi:hypothetical protein